MSEITLVLAIAENGVIGKGGAIPWRISEDLKHFKALTLGKPVLMGRKTWDSLPKKPLPGRTNIVLTKDIDWRPKYGLSNDKVVQETLLSKALDIAAEESDEVMIIGGAEIYRALLPSATRIELTEVHGDFEGDAVFAFDRSAWKEIARERHTTLDGLAYSYVTLVRS